MRLTVLAAIAILVADSGLAAAVTQADRKSVVAAVVSHLESEYVDIDVGRKAATQLRRRFDTATLEQARAGPAFAEALTRALREETGDGHLNVEFSEKALSEDDAAAKGAFTAQEMERYYGAHLNFGVRKVERLDGNVGLLELTVFPPAAMGGDTVSAAMQVLAHTDALIIDLRRNGGGGDTVSLVASYLFDDQRPLSGIYERPTGATRQQYTLPYVPGAKFGAKKPVFVLISKRTFSAAEAFAYDLQALKRATVIGEPSGGGAHPFTYRRIHPHFVLWSVTHKSVNPITGTNWQGTGVQPDVVVDPKGALEKALALIAAEQEAVVLGEARAALQFPKIGNHCQSQIAGAAEIARRCIRCYEDDALRTEASVRSTLSSAELVRMLGPAEPCALYGEAQRSVLEHISVSQVVGRGG